MDDEHPSSSLSREPDDWLVHGLPEEPPSLMKKYTTYYSSDHTYASWLPNGVCVVGLTASHPLLTSLKGGNQAAMGGEGVFEPEGRKRKRDEGEKEGKEDEEEKPASVRGSLTIDFEVGKKNGQGLRADLKESGKKAGQGLVLQPGSLLVKISVCAGGSGQMIHSMVRSPIAGKLLECNGALVKNPSLLCQAPEREGHLAVFYPSAAETSRAREKLLSKEAYDALLLRESERGVEGPAEMDPDTALILDGGLGSEIERRGVRLGGKLWSAGLLHSDPQLLFDIHAGFIEAGSDIITTASYQASIATIMEELGYGEQQARELIVSSVNIASSARDKWWEENKGKTSRLRPLVAFSCGSYGAFKADGSEFRGDYAADMTSEELVDFHRSRVELIIGNANADLLAFETIPCTKEAESICRLLESLPSAPPAWISFSCKDGSALNYNNESFQAAVSLVASSKANVIAVGVNCTAPQFVVPLLNKASLALKQLESPQAPLLIAYPNSGEEWDNEAKDWRDGLSLTPDEYAHMGLSYVEAGAKIIGGCCRVQPSHIGALRSRLLGPDPLVP